MNPKDIENPIAKKDLNKHRINRIELKHFTNTLLNHLEIRQKMNRGFYEGLKGKKKEYYKGRYESFQ